MALVYGKRKTPTARMARGVLKVVQEVFVKRKPSHGLIDHLFRN
jgi:hypothetical protein